MKYRDFELRLAHLSNRQYSAVVTDSPYGRCSGFFHLAAELETYRIPMGAAQGRVHRDLSRESKAFTETTALRKVDPEQVGRELFETVFSGKVGDIFKMCHDPNYGLRLKLIIQDGLDTHETARLHALPWELLFYQQHLAVNPAYSIVRQLDGDILIDLALTPVSHPFKPRVLVVGSNPNDTHPLDLEQEKRMLAKLALSSNIEIEALSQISRHGLNEKLEEGFHVVHFMGHGDWHEGRPVLFFTNEHGDSEGVSGHQLAEEIRGLTTSQRPRLFVLNACYGGTVAQGPCGLTGIAAELHRAGVPAVVAMRQEIGDDAAICFARSFYGSIASGLSLDEVMAKARLSLKREPALAPFWATPCLFSNLGNRELFPHASLAESEAVHIGKTTNQMLAWAPPASL